MVRSPLSRLIVLGPLIFAGMHAGAVDADRAESAQSLQQPLVLDVNTGLAASEPVLVANSAPTAASNEMGLGQLLMQDARYVLTSPARWDSDNWRDIGLLGLAVVGTAAVLDKPIQNAVQRNQNQARDRVTRFFEPFGAEYSLAVLGGFYVAGAINDDPKATAVAQDGLAASLIASGIITPALKFAFGRSRPSQNEGTHRFRPLSGNASFPSGHTTQAFAVASVIASHYEPLWIKASAYGVASLVGYSRIYNNAHFASDVLAGAAIGSLVGTSLVAFNERLRGSGVSLMPVAVAKGMGFAVAKSF